MPSLREALGGADWVQWAPIEPDVEITLHRWALSDDKHRLQSGQATEQNSREYFDVTVMIDVYQFASVDAYYGAGPALVMIVTREKLAAFTEELDAEWIAFAKKNDVHAKNVAAGWWGADEDRIR